MPTPTRMARSGGTCRSIDIVPQPLLAGTSPAHTPRNSVRQIVNVALLLLKRKGLLRLQVKVVEAPVPDSSIRSAICGEGHDGADDGPGDDVVPVVSGVDCQRAGDHQGGQQRQHREGKFPEGRAVVGPDFELRVKPQEQKPKARKGSCSVSAGEGSDGVLDHPPVRLRTDLRRVHDLLEPHAIQPRGVARRRERDVRHADVEEVRAEAADELLNDDLHHAGEDDGPQRAEDGGAGVPRRLDAHLGDDVNEDRDTDGHEAGLPRGEDPAAVRVGPFRVDDVAGLGECDGECAGGRDGREVDLAVLADCIQWDIKALYGVSETAQDGHAGEIQPVEAEPQDRELFACLDYGSERWPVGRGYRTRERRHRDCCCGAKLVA